jgi:hypothetical protein
MFDWNNALTKAGFKQSKTEKQYCFDFLELKKKFHKQSKTITVNNS